MIPVHCNLDTIDNINPLVLDANLWASFSFTKFEKKLHEILFAQKLFIFRNDQLCSQKSFPPFIP